MNEANSTALTLFGTELVDAQNALVDVNEAHRAFRYPLRRGVFEKIDPAEYCKHSI